MQTIYAIYVGINFYPDNIRSLNGCVNDVMQISGYFDELCVKNKDTLNHKKKYLLSPHDKNTLGLKESEFDIPTKTNVVKAFDLFSLAKPKDICIFYFSGHGSFVKSPVEFKGMDYRNNFESLVCYDSRGQNGMDLIDKELGYLLWKHSHDKPDVHFLTIIDSCHSGNNTRGLYDLGVKNCSRNTFGSSKNISLEELLEYEDWKNGYIKIENNIAQRIGSINHYSLSACRSNEKAEERKIDGTMRGVFTNCLVNTLRKEGINMNYRLLEHNIWHTMSFITGEQQPLFEGPRGEDSMELGQDTSVLSLKGTNYLPHKYVVKIEENATKLLVGENAGISINTNIVISSENNKLDYAKVIKVNPHNSVLDLLNLTPNDLATYNTLTGEIIEFGVSPLKVYCPSSIKFQPIWDNYRKLDNLYYFELSPKSSPFEIKKLNTSFFLTHTDDKLPLFRAEQHTDIFLNCLSKVGKWYSILRMAENHSIDIYNKVSVNVEIIEDEEALYDKSNVDSIKMLKGNRTEPNPTAISVNHLRKENAFLRISLESKREIYVGVLYLRECFGVNLYINGDTLLQPGHDNRIVINKLLPNGKLIDAMPVKINDKYLSIGITQVTDYLKIFISSKIFDVSDYVQPDLEIFTNDRSDDLVFNIEEEFFEGISIPLTITTQQDPKFKSVTIKDGKQLIKQEANILPHPDVLFSSTQNFNGTITFIDKSEQNQKLLELSQSNWGSTLGNDRIFFKSIQTKTLDSPYNMIEIETDNHGESLNINFNGHIEDNESIICYTKERKSGFIFPFGYSKDNSQIYIPSIPEPINVPETFDHLSESYNNGERDITGSVKLLFKKLIYNSNRHSKLEICTVEEGSIVKRELKDNELINCSSCLLLIHGIIGDTKIMEEAIFYQLNIHKNFEVVLAFNYENLNTPIEQISQLLYNELSLCGLKMSNEPLTVIAHSMGGLVVRYMTEQLNGASFIHKLIMLGTPNNGSELSDLKSFLFTLLSWGLNGFSLSQPYLKAIAFILKKADKHVLKTLNQMSPKSDFLTKLNNPNIPLDILNKYHLIGGNTRIIPHNTGDNFIQYYLRDPMHKLPYILVNPIFDFDINDMVVKQKSIKYIPNLKSKFQEVPTNHIGYFTNNETLNLLSTFCM